MSLVSKILTPHPPLRPASVYPHPALLRGEDTLAGRRGGGGSIFLETRDIGLPSYSNNLSTAGTKHFMFRRIVWGLPKGLGIQLAENFFFIN